MGAAPGAELVILHLTTSWDNDTTDSQVPLSQVSVAVRSGGLSAPLSVQYTYPSPDDEFYAAAVPKSGPADLILSVAGLLPQAFDLRAGRRVGTAPAVLYRDANQPQVTVKSDAVSSFTASSDAGAVTGQFGVAYAYLEDWQPFTTTLAPSPDQAYLDIEFAPSNLSVPGYASSDISPVGPLAAGAVQVQLPDGRTVPATQEYDSRQLTDIFSGDFFALVPANITSVKVTMAPGPVPVQGQDAEFNQHQISIHFPAPLTATIDLPAAWTPTNTAAPAASAPAAASPAPRHRPAGGFPWVILVVAAAAAAVLAGFAMAFRRRHPILGVIPVVWPPARLSPAAARALARGPLGALPAATAPPHPLGPPPGQGSPGDPARPALVLRLVGPLEVEGLVKPIRRRAVRRLMVVLAVTPERPMGADELSMAISSRSDRDPKVASLHSYASIFRSCAPPGVLPEAGADGYRLNHELIVVDWLILAAAAQEASTGPGWAERASAALELVRGRPLEGSSWEGIEPVVRSMQATIEDLAARLATHLLAADPAGAERAVTRGLAALPGAVGLWQLRLEAAAAGSGYGLERAWADARRELGADSALIAGDYQRLRDEVADRPSANA